MAISPYTSSTTGCKGGITFAGFAGLFGKTNFNCLFSGVEAVAVGIEIGGVSIGLPSIGCNFLDVDAWAVSGKLKPRDFRQAVLKSSTVLVLALGILKSELRKVVTFFPAGGLNPIQFYRQFISTFSTEK